MFVSLFLAFEFRILTLGQIILDQALIEISTGISPLQELESRMAKETGTIESVGLPRD